MTTGEPRASRVTLLNARALNFDDQLSFEPIEAVVGELIRHDTSEPGQIVERSHGCDVIISKELELRAPMIERLPREVRLICEAGTGYDNIDVGAAENRKILVCNAPGYAGDSVAELTIGFILALSTGLHRLARSVERGDHEDFEKGLRRSSFEVHGKTLGVIGAGDIGRRVISRAHSLFMTVVASGSSDRTGRKEGIEYVGLGQLLERSDFVTLHCPSTPRTRDLIGAEQLRQMKDDAYLINTARGDLIDEVALIEALESGSIAGAALDVQKKEPLDDDSLLWTVPNLILTPHIGWKATESRRRLIEIVAGNIVACQRGEPRNLVRE